MHATNQYPSNLTLYYETLKQLNTGDNNADTAEAPSLLNPLLIKELFLTVCSFATLKDCKNMTLVCKKFFQIRFAASFWDVIIKQLSLSLKEAELEKKGTEVSAAITYKLHSAEHKKLVAELLEHADSKKHEVFLQQLLIQNFDIKFVQNFKAHYLKDSNESIEDRKLGNLINTAFSYFYSAQLSFAKKVLDQVITILNKKETLVKDLSKLASVKYTSTQLQHFFMEHEEHSILPFTTFCVKNIGKYFELLKAKASKRTLSIEDFFLIIERIINLTGKSLVQAPIKKPSSNKQKNKSLPTHPVKLKEKESQVYFTLNPEDCSFSIQVSESYCIKSMASNQTFSLQTLFKEMIDLQINSCFFQPNQEITFTDLEKKEIKHIKSIRGFHEQTDTFCKIYAKKLKDIGKEKKYLAFLINGTGEFTFNITQSLLIFKASHGAGFRFNMQVNSNGQVNLFEGALPNLNPPSKDFQAYLLTNQ